MKTKDETKTVIKRKLGSVYSLYALGVIALWIYLGLQDSIRFFYWVGFFAFPFIGLWIVSYLEGEKNKNA